MTRRLDPVVTVAVLALLVYYVATPGIFEGKASGDGLLGFSYLPGIVFDHSIDLAVTAPQRIAPLMLRPEANGQVANPVPFGVVPLWLPFYLAGLGVQRLAGMPLTGRAPIDYWFAGLGSFAYGMAGAFALWTLLERRLGRPAARFGTVAVLGATPLAWYVVTQPLAQHATAFFLVTLLVERWDAWREQPDAWRVVVLGALGGIAISVRIQGAPWVALVGCGLLWPSRGLPARVRDALLFGGAALLALLPQLYIWFLQFGAIRVPQDPGHMRWLNPALVESLFSMRAGLLPWSPLLYVAFAGLGAAALSTRLRPLAAAAITGFLLQWWINASAWDFHASYTFGARRYVDGAFVFGLGLAAAYAAWTRRRKAAPVLWAACLAAITLNVYLMEQVRRGRVWDSAAVATTAAEYVRHLGGPRWLASTLDATGDPFVQPAGWIWALAHRAPVSSFEAVVGNYIVDRDFHVRDAVLHEPVVPLDAGSRYRLDEAPGRVRLFVPMQHPEPLTLVIDGVFDSGPGVRLAWNGRPLETTRRGPRQLMADVAGTDVRTRARTNELVVDGLAPDTQLERVRLLVKPWASLE